MAVETGRRSGGRATSVRDWLARRTQSGPGGLALLWLRRYLAASRNSGAAASAYFLLSVVPTALVVAAATGNGASGNALADRIVSRVELDDTTAEIVRQTFGTAADNLLAASLTVVVGFLLWGIGIGQLYRDVYARAWRVETGSSADFVHYTIWFFVASGMVVLLLLGAGSLRTAGWLALVPAWFLGSTLFWLWTPRYLVGDAVPLRSLLPGALLAAFVLGSTLATCPLWMGPTLARNARTFGPFGVVLTLAGFVLIWVTISMVCAVFAPVWREWRISSRSDGA